MEKSGKTLRILAIAIVIASMSGLSAFADSRHRNETWDSRNNRNDDGRYERDGRVDREDWDDRDGRRNDERQFLSGIVQRVDRQAGVVLLRQRRGGRTIAVEIVRRRGNHAGTSLRDLRRGDSVTFAGTWGRRGVFQAWRIKDVDSRNERWR